jgi:signal transduction histidine kinase
VPVDLRLLVEEAAHDALLLGHPRVKIRNAIPDDVTLSADPEQLARVFVNLLKNAREALESQNGGGAEPLVEVDFAERDGTLVIAVSDNGPGLPPRAREHLFVAFEGSARAGGTGLGLAIARELTESHGGTLHYIPGETGARFEVRLPASLRLS